MNKAEIASYLVSLHTLMRAQGEASNVSSQALADEYTKHWDLLKDAVAKESDDETGQRPNNVRTEDAADLSRNQPGVRGSDRHSATEHPRTDAHGTRD